MDRSRIRGVLVLVVVLALAVALLDRLPDHSRGPVRSAVGDVAAPPSDGSPTTAGSSGTRARGGVTPTTGRTTARVTINFAGDINFTGPLSAALAANPATALAPIAPALSNADLTVANLETAITDRGTPAAKTYTFRAPATALTALKDAGIDVASMANNHGLDYGAVGVDDALAASKAKDFPLIGIGRNEKQAMAAYRTTIRGHRIAVIGATQVLDTELIPAWTATPDHPGLASAKRADQLIAAVKAARPTTDTLVVFLHWGIETHTCPSEVQQSLARQLVDAGADIVVGGHAHRVQGGGRLDGAIVDYGLGNFAFGASSAASANTGILRVAVGGGKPATYEWEPGRIGANNLPSLSTGQAKTDALAAWNNQRGCTGLDS